MRNIIKTTFFVLGMTVATPTMAGFTSGNDFNSINQSYTAGSTIKQIIVFDSNMQGADQLDFEVQMRNGGGRPTIAPDGYTAPTTLYPTNIDTGTLTIRFYDSSGQLINTSSSSAYTLHSYADNASNPGWSAAPGDNIYDWTNGTHTVSNSTVDFSTVAYAEVEMQGSDGSWWAGNYGVQWRAPTLTYTTAGVESTNVLYNPEFGPDSSGTPADGWVSSNSYGTCGTTSGSADCVTNGGVTANASGGGEDPDGGTVNGAPGGYASTFTIATFSGASGDGTVTDTSTQSTPPAPTPVYLSSITQVQQAQRTAAFAITNGNNIDLTVTGNSNDVDIEQLSDGNYLLMNITGNSNITDVTQSGTNLDRNFADIDLNGNSNSLTFVQQGDSDKTAFVDIDGSFGTYTITQQGSGEHYLDLTSLGNDATVSVLQEGLGNHSATVSLENAGGNWNFSLTQSGDINQLFSLPHNLSDNTVVNGICTSGTCNMTVNQQ